MPPMLAVPSLLPRVFLNGAVGGRGSPPPPMAAVFGLFTPAISAADPREIFRLELFNPLMLF